jgi:hypothetical protein
MARRFPIVAAPVRLADLRAARAGVWSSEFSGMLSRLSIIVSALSVALLFAGQQHAEAGFLSANARSWQVKDDAVGSTAFSGVVFTAVLDEGAGAGAAEQNVDSTPDLAAAARNVVLSLTAGAFAAGGMNSSAPEVDGQSVPVVADVPAVTPADVPMVAWVGAEGCASLPAPLSTGILRPPRSRVRG